jgi:hypothetical protein
MVRHSLNSSIHPIVNGHPACGVEDTDTVTSRKATVQLYGSYVQVKCLPVFKLYFALNFPPYLSKGSTEVSDVILRREDMYVLLTRAPNGPEVSRS